MGLRGSEKKIFYLYIYIKIKFIYNRYIIDIIDHFFKYFTYHLQQSEGLLERGGVVDHRVHPLMRNSGSKVGAQILGFFFSYPLPWFSKKELFFSLLICSCCPARITPAAAVVRHGLLRLLFKEMLNYIRYINCKTP